MSVALAPLTVTAGTSYTYNVGSTSTVGAVVALNESPYGLNVSTGASSQWIAAQTADLVPCNSMGFSGNLTIATDSYLDNASSAPSFLVYFTAFAPGEAIRGTFPSPLARLTNGGNVGTATNLVNDTNSSGSQIIEARPNGSTVSDVTVDNAGNATLAGIVETYNAFLLHPNRSVPQPQFRMYSPDNATWEFVTEGVAGPGNSNAITLRAWENGAQGPVFAIGTANGGAACYMDASSVLHAAGPLQLTSGHQETGHCASAMVPTSTNPFGVGINFKTVMSNTPTSITLTMVDSANVTSVTADHIDIYGFTFQVSPTAINTYTKWNGTYTTVGNCLLAVDVSAQTFDHHCDSPACGHVTRGAAFAALINAPAPFGPALSYACPACGSIEAFTTSLTSADENDTTPQGSGPYATTRGAQATLIRQLMTALGLEVAP